MKLTDKQIRGEKAPEKGRRVLTDGRGLQLRITNQNVRTWSLQYRHNGRMLKTTIGGWPEVNCSNARKLAEKQRLAIATGIDPQAEKKKAKLKKLTFGTAWESFELWHIANLKPKTAKEYRRCGSADIIPRFKNIVLEDLEKSDVISLIEKIGRRAPTYANRTLTLLNKFFNWCVGRGYIKLNPALGIPKPYKEYARERVLTLHEMREIFNAAGHLSSGNELLVKLMMLTGQRESVISFLEPHEHDGTHLLIAGQRNKSGVRIKVPLSKLAQNLIHRLGQENGPFLVSTTGGSKPISGFSKLKKRLESLSGISDWRFHDFRRGMVTYLEENGLDRVYSERILNHKDRSVTGIYARPEHREHLERVYEQWSLVLSGSDGLEAQNVIMFSR